MGNLAGDTTDDMVYNAFQGYNITDVKLVREHMPWPDVGTGVASGFCHDKIPWRERF